MIINVGITFIKTFFMNLCTVFSFIKIKGCNKINQTNIIFLDIIVSIVYAAIYQFINITVHPIFMNLICYIIYLLILAITMNEVDKNFLIIMLMSICFSFATFSLACAVLFIITRLQCFKNIINTIISVNLMWIRCWNG